MPIKRDAIRRYCPISYRGFRSLIDAMGFTETVLHGSREFAYDRTIHNGPAPSERFKVRIFSSIDVNTGMTRDCGDDAIRVMLIDTVRDRPVLNWSVHRTENALPNTQKRAREAWAYVMQADHHCPACKALMVERKGSRSSKSFLGCSCFPECKVTRPLQVNRR